MYVSECISCLIYFSKFPRAVNVYQITMVKVHNTFQSCVLADDYNKDKMRQIEDNRRIQIQLAAKYSF